MPLAFLDFYLAVNLKGFGDWDPKTKALVFIVGGVLLLVFSVAFVRKVGFVGILVPTIVIGAIYAMNQNSGCMQNSTDANELGTYEKEKKNLLAPKSGDKPAPKTPPAK